MAIYWNENRIDHQGCVIETRERNGYHDSDFYAVVFNRANGQIEEIEYASTRYGGGGGATVDLTEEVKAEMAEALREDIRDRLIRQAMNEGKFAIETVFKGIDKGSMVKVVKGRKVAKGTVGKVFWMKDCQFSYHGPVETKIGIALDEEREDDGTFKNVAWTYLKNVVRTGPTEGTAEACREIKKNTRNTVERINRMIDRADGLDLYRIERSLFHSQMNRIADRTGWYYC